MPEVPEWQKWEAEADMRREREDPQHSARMVGALIILIAIVAGVLVALLVGDSVMSDLGRKAVESGAIRP